MTKPKIVKPDKPTEPQGAAEPQDITAALSEFAAEAAAPSAENVIPIGIPKPVSFLERARSKRGSTIAGVETMLQALPILKISEANDWVRLHPDAENFWSYELCFVNVPIIGDKRDQLHLIDEDIAVTYLSSKRILRFRLALATKPYDVQFLCKVPSTNMDNVWNTTTLKACEQAQSLWVQATSRKAENVEGYKIDKAKDHDAFPEPKWGTHSLEKIIRISFDADAGTKGFFIDTEDHPGLLRLIAAKQNLT
jgi:hypothetical protein